MGCKVGPSPGVWQGITVQTQTLPQVQQQAVCWTCWMMILRQGLLQTAAVTVMQTCLRPVRTCAGATVGQHGAHLPLWQRPLPLLLLGAQRIRRMCLQVWQVCLLTMKMLMSS
jgi:hypothetical protein